MKTKIVQLCQLIDKQYGEDSATIEDALARLLSYGKVFFNCSGHREVDEEKYPSFNVYVEKLPGNTPKQTKIETPTSKIIDHILTTKPMLTLEGITNLVSQELYKAKGEINELQATIRVAQQLGLDLETSGEKLV